MSTEQVLLIVAILVLPLIQSLLRAVRKRLEPAPVEGQQPSAGRPAMRERQTPPAAEDRTLSDAVTAPESEPARNAHGPVAPASPGPRRGAAAPGLHGSPGLRRTIVLMTVLEPCRAIRPHD